MSIFEWVVTCGVILLLLLAVLVLWYGQRKVSRLFAQILNELASMRVAVEMTSRSYLGHESVWEAHYKVMGQQFGTSIAHHTASDLPVLSGRRMGELFAEMAVELRKIRRNLEKASGMPSSDGESDDPEHGETEG